MAPLFSSERFRLLLERLLQAGLHSHCGDAGAVPASTERFHQQHRRHQALSQDLCG